MIWFKGLVDDGIQLLVSVIYSGKRITVPIYLNGFTHIIILWPLNCLFTD